MEVVNGFLTALNNYGPTVAIVAALLVVNALFVWREWKREDAHMKRIGDLEEKFEKTLLPIVSKYESLAEGCKAAIERSTRVFEQLIGK